MFTNNVYSKHPFHFSQSRIENRIHTYTQANVCLFRQSKTPRKFSKHLFEIRFPKAQYRSRIHHLSLKESQSTPANIAWASVCHFFPSRCPPVEIYKLTHLCSTLGRLPFATPAFGALSADNYPAIDVWPPGVRLEDRKQPRKRGTAVLLSRGRPRRLYIWQIARNCRPFVCNSLA